MEATLTIGKIAGIVVFLSIIPYAVRVYQKKIVANLVSWSVWSLVALALLANYDKSGAKDNLWTVIWGTVNPFIVTIVILWRGGIKKVGKFDMWCLVFGITSIAIWYYFSAIEMATFGLVMGISADAFAMVPTIRGAYLHPDDDRPMMWGVFSLGYMISMFSITDHTFSNYVLPLYMVIGAGIVFVILAKYRVKNKTPLREWV